MFTVGCRVLQQMDAKRYRNLERSGSKPVKSLIKYITGEKLPGVLKLSPSTFFRFLHRTEEK